MTDKIEIEKKDGFCNAIYPIGKKTIVSYKTAEIMIKSNLAEWKAPKKGPSIID